MAAFQTPDNNRIAKDITTYYESGNFDKAVNIELYNKFIEQNYPDDKDALIKAGTKFAQTDLDQRVGFGLYMASKNDLVVS